MKKFISMVMAAAMVVSLVPATAFAYEVESKVKVLDVAELTEDQAKDAKENGIEAVLGERPEVQIKITSDDYTANDVDNDFEIELKLTNAEWVDGEAQDFEGMFEIDFDGADVDYTVSADDVEEDEATITLSFGGNGLVEDDIIVIAMDTLVTKTKAGAEATVTVKSKDLGLEATDLVYAVVQDNVLAIEADDTVDVAEEEIVELEEITIEATTGYLPTGDNDGEDLKLKLNSGFEFVGTASNNDVVGATVVDIDEDVMWITVPADTDEIKLTGIEIEATTAKVGDVATITVSAVDWEKATCDVATVVGEGLVISVDEDEDVPEMWSGVAVDTEYLTDEDDNTSLAFTIEETVAGAYSEKDVVELVLPEGVWVMDVTVSDNGGDGANDWDALFEAAYQEGDHTGFEFKKRTIEESEEEAIEIEVEFELVADPGFVGDVVVEMLVDGESVGEVTVATFKTPMVVEASQNDLKIDYRNTAVGSDIVVKEAEAGLWATGLVIGFDIDDHGVMAFEDDVEYVVNEEESAMEIDGEDAYVCFEVEEESDEEAAVITITNLSLFMERNIPAGAYDLVMSGNVFVEYNAQTLYAPDCGAADCDGDCDDKEDDCIVDDVCDYSDVAKEGFINVVTAGREQDDASFTTKVVVPVGEMYIVAGEQTVALDVPAYVSEAGYTMLPVRAVATALGINNNNVLWDQATKTVTILYGQRIITMTVGAKVINVNGSAIPASASVEVVNGRTFLPMRDLATALGVTDITWDAATKTATLNGNV